MRVVEGDGWIGIASLPEHRQMPREWKFEVLKPDGTPAHDSIPGLPLMFDLVFGPDVEDVACAREQLRQFIDTARKST